jgi:hypothetical protein
MENAEIKKVVIRYKTLKEALLLEREKLIDRGRTYLEGSEAAKIDWEKRKLYDFTNAELTETHVVWYVENLYGPQHLTIAPGDSETAEWPEPENEPEARGDREAGLVIQECRELYERELIWSDVEVMKSEKWSVHDYIDYLDQVESFGIIPKLKVYSDAEVRAMHASVDDDIPELPMPTTDAADWQRQSVFTVRHLVRKVDGRVSEVKGKIKTWIHRAASSQKAMHKRVSQLRRTGSCSSIESWLREE